MLSHTEKSGYISGIDDGIEADMKGNAPAMSRQSFFKKGLLKIGQRCYNVIDRYGQEGVNELE